MICPFSIKKKERPGSGQIFLICLVIASSSVCSRFTQIRYELSVIEEKSFCGNQDYSVIRYAENEKLRFSSTNNKYLTHVVFHKKEDLKKIGEFLYTGRISGGGNNVEYRMDIPDILPIRVTLQNNSSNTLFFDYLNFQIRNLSTDKVYPIIGPKAFYDDYYNRNGMILMDYIWAFEFRPSYSFLYKIPQWYLDFLKKPATSSQAEILQLRRFRLKRLKNNYTRQRHISPGNDISGFLLFPLLPSDSKYVLEYVPGKSDKATSPNKSSSLKIENFSFSPICFSIVSKKGDFKLDEKDTKFSKQDESGNKSELLDFARYQKKHRALMEMHKQIHRHDTIQKKSSAESR